MQSSSTPTVHITGADPHAEYTLICTDPDAPDPANPTKGEYVHWIVTNIKQADVKTGTAVLPYVYVVLGGGPLTGWCCRRVCMIGLGPHRSAPGLGWAAHRCRGSVPGSELHPTPGAQLQIWQPSCTCMRACLPACLHACLRARVCVWNGSTDGWRGTCRCLALP